MKATGVVRKIDNLGRIVLPKELRRTLEINSNDPLEIYVDDGGYIVIKKVVKKCIFCGESNDLITFRDKDLCNEFLNNINKEVKK